MKSITREWVDKAEADFATAEREFIVHRNPNYDAVCFHCQQCAEKLIKARLQEADIRFIKTHDLSFLLDLVVSVEPTWETLRSELTRLQPMRLSTVIPGNLPISLKHERPSKRAAKRARLCTRLWE